jgi:hypothetical protein
MSLGFQMGTQLIASEGYRMLEKNITYYFLRSYSKCGASSAYVQLVHFTEKEGDKNSPMPIPFLIVMNRDEFEGGVRMSKISRCEVQASMPPWLSHLEGKNLKQLNSEKGMEKPHEERILAKVKIIEPLIADWRNLLEKDNPDYEINQYAKKCRPVQKGSRIRLWFYLYLVFGQNSDVLHYRTKNLGTWLREESRSHVKRGAPSIAHGKEHGYNADSDMIERMLKGYAREVGLGVELTTIYVRVLLKNFGCKVRNAKDGLKEYFHPSGHPYPSMRMFRYYIDKEFGKYQVQERLKGNVLARRKNKPHQGSFSSAVCNIGEHVEGDAYVVEEVPRGSIEGSSLGNLFVARYVDGMISFRFGIGFSMGAERASAYRMAKFCCAISKVKFCQLFGITITEDQWPSIGIPPHLIEDRGVGSTQKAKSSLKIGESVIDEMPPSGMGQSKPTVESGNPYERKNEDRASHFQSDLRLFQLTVREILRVIAENDTAKILAKLPPDVMFDINRATPKSVFNRLNALGRNDLIQISYEDAVRSFLDPIEVVLKKDGVYFKNQLYSSPMLIELGFLDRNCSFVNQKLSGYMMAVNLRHIWVDIGGILIELMIAWKTRSGKNAGQICLQELEMMEQKRKELTRATEHHRLAGIGEMEMQFSEETGLQWNAGSRKKGRAKRKTKIAIQENKEAIFISHGTGGGDEE